MRKPVETKQAQKTCEGKANISASIRRPDRYDNPGSRIMEHSSLKDFSERRCRLIVGLDKINLHVAFSRPK